MKQLLLIALSMLTLASVTIAQTDPAPFNLSNGSFTLTGFQAATPAGSYPTSGNDGTAASAGNVANGSAANLIFHRHGGASDPILATNTTSDYTLAYNLTSGARVNALGTAGFSLLNAGSTGVNYLGAAVLGLNTTGRTNIQVSWTGQTIAAGASRIYAIRLQYRIGTTGTWADASSTTSEIEYVSGATGSSNVFAPVTLPTVTENQAIVQLRWKYYYIGGAGSRPQLAVDDITVSSSSMSPSLCSTPSTMPSALTFPATNTTSITGSFAPASGGSSGYIVFAALASTTTMPALTDGITYSSVNAPSGYIFVTDGAATTFSANTLLPNTAYNFFVFAYNNTNCTGGPAYATTVLTGSATTQPVPCNQPTLPTISASASLICETGTATLSINIGALNDATVWKWYSGSCGGTAVATGSSVIVSPSATTTYYVRGEGGCATAGGCADVTIAVNPPPTPASIVVTESICQPGCLVGGGSFSMGLCGIGSTMVFFSDAQGNGATSTVPTYDQAQAMTIYYACMDNITQCHSAIQTLTTQPGSCSVPATPAPIVTNSICQPGCIAGGGSISFASCGNGCTLTFFDDAYGTNPTTAFPTYNQIQPVTVYFACVANLTGCQNIQSVTTAPDACIVPANPADPTSNSPACGSAIITATGTAPAGEVWYWQTSSTGTNTANNASVPYIATSTGTYFVRARSVGTGCWSNGVGSVTVFVNPSPAIAVAGNDQAICNGTSTAMAANAPSNGTGRWSVVSGPNISSSQFVDTVSPTTLFTPANSGTYVLRWTIGNPPCQSSTDELTVTVNPRHTITAIAGANGYITPSGSTQVCDGGNLTYSFTPALGYHVDVVLVDNNPVSPTGNSYTLTNIVGPRTIQVSFAADCVQPTVPSISASANPICNTDSATLSIGSNSLGSATGWQWYIGGCGSTAIGTGSSITVQPTATTIYYVRGEGDCVTACACAEITIAVNADPASCCSTSTSIGVTPIGPSSTVNTGGDPTNIYLGYGPASAMMTASTAGAKAALTYSWSPTTNLSNMNGASTIFTPTAAGTYTYTVTANSGNGCTSQSSVTFCVKNVKGPSYDAPIARNPKNIYLCHSGQQLTLATNTAAAMAAVNDHLSNHPGDRLGLCSEAPCGGLPTARLLAGNPDDGVIGELIIVDALEMIVYPNPSRNEFHLAIESSSSDFAAVRVFDLAGRVVESAPALRTNIDLTIGRSLSAGVYVIEVRDGNTAKRIKIVKL